MAKTKIEYLDWTWSPTHGCSPVSEGCKNCWARIMSKRLAGMGARGYSKDDPFKVVFCPEKLDEPFHIKKPSRIGVSFMGDLFHGDIQTAYIMSVLDVIEALPLHTFLLLTKRPMGMAAIMAERKAETEYLWGYRKEYILPKNIWLGVSVENQDNMWRVEELLKILVVKRFVSFEPLLEGISLSSTYIDKGRYWETGVLDWVICGCESGQNRRPFDMNWARSLKDQCVEAGVPYFFKQGIVNGKIVKMPELDGQIWNQFPEGV